MIVVVGSLNMDLIVQVDHQPKPGETALGSDYVLLPGGKGGNQAVAAARAGGQVRMVARVGRDSFGHTLRNSLREASIDIAGVREGQRPSGVALISVSADGENRVIVSPGVNSELVPQDLDPYLFRDASAVLIQLEIPRETVRAAVRLGRAVGAQVVLNAAPARAVAPRDLEGVDVVVVNEVEVRQIIGLTLSNSVEGREAVRRLAEWVPYAVVTLGAQGLVFALPGGSGVVPAFPARVVDTTGAGDAFVGVTSQALAEGRGFEEALLWGSAAGALASERSGAQPSFPGREEILALCGAGADQ